MNDDDPDVFAELDRRTKSREKKKQDLEKRMQEQPAESAQAKGEKWKDLRMQIAASRHTLSVTMIHTVTIFDVSTIFLHFAS